MKKLLMLAFCFSTVFCSVNAYSQRLESPIKVPSPRLETPVKIAQPDFSGTWKLNFVKSRLTEAAAANDISDDSLILTIDQKLPVISVNVTIRHLAQSGTVAEFNIYTDGRASEMPGPSSGSSRGTAEWKGDKLVITVFASPKDRNGLVVELELSADGNTLISTLKATLPKTGPDGKNILVVDNTRTQTMIYDRIVDVRARSNKTSLFEEK